VITYVSTIPAGAVERQIDGNLYAHTNLKLDVQPGRVTVKGGIETRMMRVKEVHPTNGTATVVIGRAGDAIANTVNLPFSVTAIHNEDSAL
jgi:hypothetical protein